MTVRIRAITPIDVSDDELRRRQERYAELSPREVQVELYNLAGAPRQLDSEAACRASERLAVEEALRTDPRRYDAVMVDCVLDPGLEELERHAALPAFGMLKLCAGALAAAGYRFGAVTRNQPIADELEARVAAHGFRHAFDRVAVLDLSIEDVADAQRWNAVLAEAAARFQESPTRVLINGCSAVDVLPRDGGGVAVIDPMAFALGLLGFTLQRGLPLPWPGAAPARVGRS